MVRTRSRNCPRPLPLVREEVIHFPVIPRITGHSYTKGSQVTCSYHPWSVSLTSTEDLELTALGYGTLPRGETEWSLEER